MNKPSEYSSIIKDAWLNIDVDESNLINPFSLQTEHDFPVKLTWILSNPEVFSTERLDAYNWMMSMWALMPVIILLSMITFALTRTLRERTPGY